MSGHTAERARVFVHPDAEVEDGAVVGPGTRIWAGAHVRSGATVGSACIIGRNVFIDTGAVVGDRVKVQNNASVYDGTTLADGVFVGPHVVFTNDRLPRAITPGGRLKAASDWTRGSITVGHGAAIGAGSIIVTGVSIGRWAMVGAGSVVTRDVGDHALVVGAPARVVGFVSASGTRCATAAAAASLSDAEAAADAEAEHHVRMLDAGVGQR